MGPQAGDGRGRRRNVGLIASVPVAWWLGVLTVPHVLAAAVLVQAFFTFFDGANFGALPVLVGRDRVGEANAAIWGFGGVLDLLVPAAVGLALAVVHPADLLALDALSYVASALAVRAIRRPLSEARESGPALRLAVVAGDVAEGIRFLWGHRGVRSMTLVGMLQSLAGAGFMGLVVVWCDRVLGIGTSGWRFGLLFSVWGVGGILASVAFPRLLRRTSPARLTLGAIPVSAAAGILVALSQRWHLAAAAMVVWGVAYQLVIMASITYRQQVTPERLLSRVNTGGRMLSWGWAGRWGRCPRGRSRSTWAQAARCSHSSGSVSWRRCSRGSRRCVSWRVSRHGRGRRAPRVAPERAAGSRPW